MGKLEMMEMALQLKASERYELAGKIMQSLDKFDAQIDNAGVPG